MSKIAGKYSVNDYNKLINENGLYSSKLEVDAAALIKFHNSEDPTAANVQLTHTNDWGIIDGSNDRVKTIFLYGNQDSLLTFNSTSNNYGDMTIKLFRSQQKLSDIDFNANPTLSITQLESTHLIYNDLNRYFHQGYGSIIINKTEFDNEVAAHEDNSSNIYPYDYLYALFTYDACGHECDQPIYFIIQRAEITMNQAEQNFYPTNPRNDKLNLGKYTIYTNDTIKRANKCIVELQDINSGTIFNITTIDDIDLLTSDVELNLTACEISRKHNIDIINLVQGNGNKIFDAKLIFTLTADSNTVYEQSFDKIFYQGNNMEMDDSSYEPCQPFVRINKSTYSQYERIQFSGIVQNLTIGSLKDEPLYVIYKVINKDDNSIELNKTYEFPNRVTDDKPADERTFSLDLGYLEAGNYTVSVELKCDSTDDRQFLGKQTFDLEVGSSGYSHTVHDLLFNFDSKYETLDNVNDGYDGTTIKYWTSEDGSYAFELDNLAFYDSGENHGSGWVQDSEINSKKLSFLSQSKGTLKYKDVSGGEPKWSNYTTGYEDIKTLEVLVKAKDLGIKNAPIVSIGDKILITSDDIKYMLGNSLSTFMTIDEWVHIAIVYDDQIRIKGGKFKYYAQPDNEYYEQQEITNENIELENKEPTVKIYINGVLTTAKKGWEIEEEDTNISTTFYLNYSPTNEQYGYTDFRICRAYKVGLNPKEVLWNYISSLNQVNKQHDILLRNDEQISNIPVIYYVRENNDSNTTFETLHSITTKAISKKTKVQCYIYYTTPDGNQEHIQGNVHLQGTSSLTYPVKNYQLKDLKRSNNGGKTYTVEGWVPNNKKSEWVLDDTYTLKCDYMEQAHKNNTPTAVLYKDVVEQIVEHIVYSDPNINNLTSNDINNAKLSKYSPAKQSNPTAYDGETEISYNDAIDGFPCLVYYNENVEGTATGNYKTDSGVQFAGTYMFNIDKEGKQLGFELDDYSCISQEATSNQEGSASTFNYDGSENLNYEFASASLEPRYVYNGDIEESLEAYAPIKMGMEFLNGKYDALYKELEIEKNEDTVWIQIKDSSGLILCDEKGKSLESNIKSKFGGALTIVINKKPYRRTPGGITIIDDVVDNYFVKLPTSFKDFFSYEYCMAYFLQMMVFTQIDNVGKNSMFDAWYSQKQIDLAKEKEFWTDEADITSTQIIWPANSVGGYDVDGYNYNSLTDNEKATLAKFLAICHTPLYPRPYDMDSQMGETNAGFDSVPYYAEINPAWSPFQAGGATQLTGIHYDNHSFSRGDLNDDPSAVRDYEKNHGRYGGIDPTTHQRVQGYNVRYSKLWDIFYDLYKDEIRTCYNDLRETDKVYDKNKIFEKIESLTSNAIGETYYNKDAVQKYLTLDNFSEHQSKLQGNRNIRYRQFMSKRLDFLDTFFRKQSGNTNNVSLNTKEPYPYLGIDVHEPQYVTIEVSDKPITVFIDPRYKYSNPFGGIKMDYDDGSGQYIIENLDDIQNNTKLSPYQKALLLFDTEKYGKDIIITLYDEYLKNNEATEALDHYNSVLISLSKELDKILPNKNYTTLHESLLSYVDDEENNNATKGRRHNELYALKKYISIINKLNDTSDKYAAIFNITDANIKTNFENILAKLQDYLADKTEGNRNALKNTIEAAGGSEKGDLLTYLDVTSSSTLISWIEKYDNYSHILNFEDTILYYSRLLIEHEGNKWDGINFSTVENEIRNSYLNSLNITMPSRTSSTVESLRNGADYDEDSHTFDALFGSEDTNPGPKIRALAQELKTKIFTYQNFSLIGEEEVSGLLFDWTTATHTDPVINIFGAKNFKEIRYLQGDGQTINNGEMNQITNLERIIKLDLSEGKGILPDFNNCKCLQELILTNAQGVNEDGTTIFNVSNSYNLTNINATNAKFQTIKLPSYGCLKTFHTGKVQETDKKYSASKSASGSYAKSYENGKVTIPLEVKYYEDEIKNNKFIVTLTAKNLTSSSQTIIHNYTFELDDEKSDYFETKSDGTYLIELTEDNFTESSTPPVIYLDKNLHDNKYIKVTITMPLQIGEHSPFNVITTGEDITSITLNTGTSIKLTIDQTRSVNEHVNSSESSAQGLTEISLTNQPILNSVTLNENKLTTLSVDNCNKIKAIGFTRSPADKVLIYEVEEGGTKTQSYADYKLSIAEPFQKSNYFIELENGLSGYVMNERIGIGPKLQNLIVKNCLNLNYINVNQELKTFTIYQTPLVRFDCCKNTKLEQLDLSGIKTINQLLISGATALKTIILNNNAEIYYFIAHNCKSLSTVGTEENVCDFKNFKTLPTDSNDNPLTIGALITKPQGNVYLKNAYSVVPRFIDPIYNMPGKIGYGTVSFTISDCPNIKEIINLNYLGDLEGLFANCTSLKNIRNLYLAPGRTYKRYSTISSINNLFSKCGELETITWNEQTGSMDEGKYITIIDSKTNTEKDLTQRQVWNLCYSGTGTFQNCSKLKYWNNGNTISIPELLIKKSQNSISYRQYLDSACQGTPFIASADLFEHQELNDLSRMFRKTAIIGFQYGADGSSPLTGLYPCVTNLEGMFWECPSLTSLPTNFLTPLTDAKDPITQKSPQYEKIKAEYTDSTTGFFKKEFDQPSEGQDLWEIGRQNYYHDEPNISIAAMLYGATNFNDLDNLSKSLSCGKVINADALIANYNHDEQDNAISLNKISEIVTALPKLQSARAMFYNNKIDFSGTRVSNIFVKESPIKFVDFMFAQSEIIGIDESNSGNEIPCLIEADSVSNSLLSAKGLFANCYKLQGKIPGNFFGNAGNLITIGGTRGAIVSTLDEGENLDDEQVILQKNLPFSSVYWCVGGGAFCNTQLTYEDNFLAGLTKLKDTSYLFFKGRTPERIAVSNSDAESLASIFAAGSYSKTNISLTNAGDTSSTEAQLQSALFSALGTEVPILYINASNNNLQDISYMYAGNKYLSTLTDYKTEIVDEPVAGEPEYENKFLLYYQAVRVMDGLFKNTSISISPEDLFGNVTNENLTSISCVYANTNVAGIKEEDLFTLDSDILSEKTKLINADYAFANSAVSEITDSNTNCLLNSTQLRTINGMFSNCKHFNKFPTYLYSSSCNQLNSINYLFANTEKLFATEINNGQINLANYIVPSLRNLRGLFFNTNSDIKNPDQSQIIPIVETEVFKVYHSKQPIPTLDENNSSTLYIYNNNQKNPAYVNFINPSDTIPCGAEESNEAGVIDITNDIAADTITENRWNEIRAVIPRWFKYWTEGGKAKVASLNNSFNATTQIYTWSIKTKIVEELGEPVTKYTVRVQKIPYVTPFTALQAPGVNTNWSLSTIDFSDLELTDSEENNNHTISIDLTQAFASMPMLQKAGSSVAKLIKYYIAENNPEGIKNVNIDCEGLFSHSSLATTTSEASVIDYDVPPGIEINNNFTTDGMFYGTKFADNGTLQQSSTQVITLINPLIPTQHDVRTNRYYQFET